MVFTKLKGGYRVPYDPRPALDRLKIAHDNAINERWVTLYHQGDVVDLAFCAAVPALVDLGELSWDAVIEAARDEGKNPDVPAAIMALRGANGRADSRFR